MSLNNTARTFFLWKYRIENISDHWSVNLACAHDISGATLLNCPSGNTSKM